MYKVNSENIRNNFLITIFSYQIHMEEFQSGQMDLTVNQMLRLRGFESYLFHNGLLAGIAQW